MKPWYLANPVAYEAFQQALAVEHQSLHVELLRGRIFIRGTLFLRDGAVEVDHFQIEIEVPESYPRDLPLVREIGGRIPKIADRHFFNGDVACVMLPDERDKYFPEDAPLIDFIRGPVQNYFLNQASYERTGRWLDEPRPHGKDGIREYYQELLGDVDDVAVLTCVRYLASKQLKGHWNCHCGSGRPLRQCHFGLLQNLRARISRRTASGTLKTLLGQTKPKD